MGYSDEEICGTDFRRISIEQDIETGAPDQEMEIALKTGRGIDQRYHRRKDGSLFWADGLVMPLLDSDGNVSGFLKIIRDFTEQKQAEEGLWALTEQLEHRVRERTKEVEESRARLRSLVFELNRAEQMERQRIAAELHDGLAQLLTAGRLSLESANRVLGQTAPPVLRQVEEIMSQATRTTRGLMAELSGPSVLEDDDLVATIRWLVDKFGREGLNVILTYSEPTIPLGRDLLILLFQSVRELLLNVQKHADVRQVSVAIERLPDRVEIEVSDEGCGFDSQTSLARPGKEDGFGLLNMNERLRWLEGALSIHSIPGTGTQVKISLPVPLETTAPTEGLAEDIPARTRLPRGEGNHEINVLLIDDHRMVREGFRSIIEDRSDIRVVGEAGNGVEALEKTRALRPDVVIMDINMPIMNGLEATRCIRQEMPDVAVVGLSLHSKDDMAETIQKAGAVSYVSKDEACDTLCETIRKAYEDRHAGP